MNMNIVSPFLLLVLVINPGAVISTETTDIGSKTKIGFSDLIEDVQYLILKQLTTEDVMHMMEVFPMLSNLGTSIYQMRYGDFEIFVCDTYMMSFITSNFAEDHNVDPPQLNFNSHKTVFKVVKTFGSVIQRIQFDRKVLTAQKNGVEFSQLINEHGSKSLTHLNLGAIEPVTFQQFTVSFEEVECLTFIVEFHYYKDEFNTITPLNQTFPNLRQLKMKLGANVDYSFIDCVFPYLEHLEVIIGPESWKQRNHIEGLLTKNSHIKSLDTGLFDKQAPGEEYFKSIGELLPNIENLSFSELQLEGPVEFDHVKRFALTLPTDTFGFKETIGKLSLPQLEMFKIIVKSINFVRFVDTWNEFFARHTYISKLHYVNQIRDCNQIMEGEFGLPNLTELTLECVRYTKPAGIRDFLNNHKKVVKFQMIKRIPTHSVRLSEKNRNVTDLKMLQGMLEQEWNVEVVCNGNGYSFERKLID